jgi:hypothetical protein
VWGLRGHSGTPGVAGDYGGWARASAWKTPTRGILFGRVLKSAVISILTCTQDPALQRDPPDWPAFEASWGGFLNSTGVNLPFGLAGASVTTMEAPAAQPLNARLHAHAARHGWAHKLATKVSPKRLLDESPWLQFTSNASRFDPHRASISSRSGQVLLPLRVFESHTKLIRGEIAVSPPGGGGWGGGCKLVLCWDNVQSLWREKELWYKVALVPSAEVTRPAGWQPPAPNQRIDWRTDPQVWAGPPSIQISGFLTAYGRSC